MTKHFLIHEGKLYAQHEDTKSCMGCVFEDDSCADISCSGFNYKEADLKDILTLASIGEQP